MQKIIDLSEIRIIRNKKNFSAKLWEWESKH